MNLCTCTQIPYTRIPNKLIGGRGPIICRPSDEEVTFCANPRMRGENDYCNATVDCTSSCRCFDGRNERMTNTDEFTLNGIDGQGERYWY